jgi:DNA polymerase-3 subunit delta'
MSIPSPQKTAKKQARKSRNAADPTGASTPTEDSLPSQEEIGRMLDPVRNFLHTAEYSRIRGFLGRLSAVPPQVLLLEGGTADGRLAAAQYWAARLNCEPEKQKIPTDSAAMSLPGVSKLPGLPAGMQTGAGKRGVLPADSCAIHSGPLPEQKRNAFLEPPCLACSACIRMAAHLHRDCFFFDGLAGSIKIDDVRAMRTVLGEPPREARRRMVIFREAQSLVEAAANALLKSFEEPLPDTTFILLVPQRERLLPTLVSRSVVLTLPWPEKEDRASREELAPFEAALCSFLRTGRELFERSGTKGAVDAHLVQALTGVCRRALTVCIKARNGGEPPEGELENLLARLPETRMRMLDEALAECQDSLLYGVNPVLVLEWLATRMFFLLPRQ